MSNLYTADRMAKDYMTLREGIREKEEEIKKLKELQVKITDKMLELCAEQNVDSLKTEFGTISRRVQSSYWTSDWEQFYKMVEEHGAFHLLEKRIHNSNMREFLKENPDTVPAGLQAKQTHVIRVIKPSAK